MRFYFFILIIYHIKVRYDHPYFCLRTGSFALIFCSGMNPLTPLSACMLRPILLRNSAFRLMFSSRIISYSDKSLPLTIFRLISSQFDGRYEQLMGCTVIDSSYLVLVMECSCRLHNLRHIKIK